MLAYSALFAGARGINTGGPPFNISAIFVFCSEAFAAAVAPMLLVDLAAYLMGRDRTAQVVKDRILPRHEFAARLGLALSPIPLQCIMMFNRAYFFPRYGLCAAVGVAPLVALLFHSAAGSGRLGSAMLAMLVLWVAGTETKRALALPRDRTSVQRQV